MWALTWPALIFILATLVALLLRGALLSVLGRWAQTPNGWSSLAQAIRLPSVLWSVVVGLWVAVVFADATERMSSRVSQSLSLVLEVAVVLGDDHHRQRPEHAHPALERAPRARPPDHGLGQSVARGLVYIVGLLVILAALGIQITPILTALGVGGLAVALALQDTLSNLFAGIHLLADRPIRVGDYVKVADTVEGHVEDIGWRLTRVRMLQNVVVTIPNKRVAESIITNYDLPEPGLALQIRVGVDYAADPDLVERLLLDEARAVEEVPGLRGQPAPSARLIPGFGECSLDFTLTCHVKSFTDQFSVQHEIRKRILRRFAAEASPSPYGPPRRAGCGLSRPRTAPTDPAAAERRWTTRLMYSISLSWTRRGDASLGVGRSRLDADSTPAPRGRADALGGRSRDPGIRSGSRA